MRYVPNRPEALLVVLLRNDDLLILLATTPFLDASLCSKKRELLPFVKELQHKPFKTQKPRFCRDIGGCKLVEACPKPGAL